MFNRNQLILVVITLSIFVFAFFLFWQGLAPEFKKINSNNFKSQNLAEQVMQASSSSEVLDPKFEKIKVLRVIDGDTIDTDIGKIRYIGVDTPETVDPRRQVGCFGKEASNENKRLIEGKEILVEKDVSETDKYGRLLRYVYLKLDDGELLFVNDYLIRQGFALTVTYPPDVKYIDQFTQAQNQARENQRGLWRACN